MTATVSPSARRALAVAAVVATVTAAVGLQRVARQGAVGPVDLVWGGAGFAATAAVPTYLLARHRLVSPALGFLVAIVVILVAPPTPGEPAGFALLWPLLPLGSLLLGSLEFVTRTYTGVFPPQTA